MSPDQAVEELLGLECRGCGGVKPSKMSHCRKCYKSLPRSMQLALYRRVGRGYEEAYVASLDYLHAKRADV